MSTWRVTLAIAQFRQRPDETTALGETLFVNLGDLSFSEHTLPQTVEYARLFPVGVDGDDRLDIVAIDPGKTSVSMLRNTIP